MGDLAIDVCGVEKTFGSGDAAVQALRGVDFEVRHGEMMFLVGPSGCGKTTLLSILCGTLRADCGSLRVMDRDLQALDDREATDFRAQKVGFIFQQFNLIPTLTVEDNVAVPLLIQGWELSVARCRAKAMLARVGLDRKAGERPPNLSGGQQQRVAIARALVHEPLLVVCDEPTSALDSVNGHQVMDLLREVATGSGRALIVVTHDNRIFGYADRMAEMEDGRILRVLESRDEIAARHGL